MSISYHELSSPNEDKGVFGEATRLAAAAYEADHTLFGVNGTSGSNFVVIKALQEQFEGDLHILSTRNVHMSIVNAVDDYRAQLNFMPPNIDNELEAFLPNTTEQIIENIQKFKPNVLLLSNPTYEGASVDLSEVIRAVRDVTPEIVIYIDEAWGAHFVFSDKLPISAMQAGADICTQSTHKQGNALQQSSMIHWKDGRIDDNALRRSYRSLSTTSPSFHMLAAMDATREFMEARGEAEIDKLISLSSEFGQMIQAIGGCSVRSFEDPTKLLVHFEDRSAPLVAHKLEEKGYISEKSSPKNMLLIVGFQNTLQQAMETAGAIEEAVTTLPMVNAYLPPFPSEIIKGELGGKAHQLLIHEALGKTCLECVVPYPPGIPLLTRGERVTKAHIDYLNAAVTNEQTEVLMNESGSLLVTE
jgi:lysine decarboxylase